MKKQFVVFGALILGVIATLIMSPAAQAKGEVYSFTNATSSSGYGGSEITVGSGKAFKSKTVFKQASTSTTEKYGAKVSGYSVYYKVDSWNLTDNAAPLVPNCKTAPAFIALKSAEASKGIMYPAATNSSGVSSSCFTSVGMNLDNLGAEGDYVLSADITIRADTVSTGYSDGYYNVLSGPLTELKNNYYKSLGTRAPCSSQGCNDTTWKQMVTSCWTSARSSAADSARYSGQAGVAYDSEQGTKDNFATCLAGKINNGQVATARDILDILKEKGVTAAAVNEGGNNAGEEARTEQEGVLAVDSGETVEGSSTCVVEGVGWIICPITNFLAGIADASFGVIKNFLVINVQLFNTESGTYIAWSSFRNIANVAFVILFLVIIFSQLTGAGISNYGVKKTLPRLVIAAILVNISFFVCQLAVDLSQVVGVGIREILKSVPIGNGDITTPSWGEMLGNVLMGAGLAVAAAGAVVGGAAVLGLSISLPVLLAALLAILMTLLILIGRQAGIVILIVLSPLAFVAYMLPNTEKWFKRWYQIFFTLLMVFPIVALLYGGGELASKIISSVAASNDTPADMKFFLGITAMAVAAIPLIMTPTILKGAMNGLGSIGTKLSGIASKTNSKVGSAVNTNSRFGEAKQGLKNRFALNRATRRANSSIQKGIDQSKFGRALGLDKGTARAIKAIDAEEGVEVEAAIAQIQHETTSTNRVNESARMLKQAIISGDVTKARAAQRILLSSGNVGLSTLQQVYSGTHGSDDASRALSQQAHGALDSSAATGYLRSELNSAGLKGKNNALARFGFEEIEPSTFSSLVEDGSTYSKLNSVELSGQSEPNLYNNQAAISQGAAQAVLENSAAAAQLDDEKRAIFTARAQGTTYVKGSPTAPAAAPAAAAAPASSGAQTAPTPRDVHDAAQRAQRAQAESGELQIPRTPPTTPPTTPPPTGGQPTP